MTTFDITVQGGREDVQYRITERSHDDTAAHAAIEALQTYRRHGHNTFPYNRDGLTVVVRPIEDEEPSS